MKSQTVAGIDVGGEKKGFHAVALVNGQFADCFSSKSADEVAGWCRETMNARVIAIDAPCRWSKDGRARPAERELMGKGIWCFSTPTEQRALDHPTNHFGWMRNGEALFQALEPTHTLCHQLPLATGQKYCLETFPHAITWHLRGGNADARQKRKQRRELLAQAGIDLAKLTNIDLVDAALCALTAHRAAKGAACVSYGDPDTGLIIVPSSDRGVVSKLSFKTITPENWQEPDIPRTLPKMTAEIWIRDHLTPQLTSDVPNEVRGLFEVARAAIIYGWYFYPLLTLGSDQLFRALEAAVHHCCEKHSIPTEFEDKNGKKRAVRYDLQVKRLVEKGIVPAEEESRWEGARRLRNSASHPKWQSIFDPSTSLSMLTLVSEDINRLFNKEIK